MSLHMGCDGTAGKFTMDVKMVVSNIFGADNVEDSEVASEELCLPVRRNDVFSLNVAKVLRCA